MMVRGLATRLRAWHLSGGSPVTLEPKVPLTATTQSRRLESGKISTFGMINARKPADISHSRSCGSNQGEGLRRWLTALSIGSPEATFYIAPGLQ